MITWCVGDEAAMALAVSKPMPPLAPRVLSVCYIEYRTPLLENLPVISTMVLLEDISSFYL